MKIKIKNLYLGSTIWTEKKVAKKKENNRKQKDLEEIEHGRINKTISLFYIMLYENIYVSL